MTSRRVLLLASLLAALATFCVVQDRVTAAGARRYVELEREAAAGRRAPITIDEVMVPAIAQSVRAGLRWGGGVLLVGLVLTAFVNRPGHRRREG